MRIVPSVALAIVLLLLVSSCGGQDTPAIPTATTATNGPTVQVPTQDTASSGPTSAESAGGTPQADSNPVTVGRQAIAGPFVLTVNTARRTDHVGANGQAPAGYTFVVADITVENGGTENIDFNIFDFGAKDSEGLLYKIYVLAPEPMLNGGALAPGTKSRGNLAFEVPLDAKGFSLTFDTFTLLGETYSASIKMLD